jgi:hypothetical protein
VRQVRHALIERAARSGAGRVHPQSRPVDRSTSSGQRALATMPCRSRRENYLTYLDLCCHQDVPRRLRLRRGNTFSLLAGAYARSLATVMSLGPAPHASSRLPRAALARAADASRRRPVTDARSADLARHV